MGNSLIPNTNINKDAVGNCGANTQWVMHHGVRTDKAKDQVSVFLFDKRTISKQSSSSKEEFINALKRDPQILAKFKNDGILTLLNPLLEDQKRIGFVTEPVRTSLNVLIDKGATDQIVESDLEIKLHILDIAETLSYLQNDVKAAHLAVSPENIYITTEGKWKLGGFLFSTQILQGDTATSPADFSEKSGHIRLTPNLRFTAPEVTETPSRCTYTSDMFSLACLIFTLYKIKADGTTRDPYLIKANSLHGYREIIQHLHRIDDFSVIPDQIRPVIFRMLQTDPNMRITASEFVHNSWFKDPFVQTVKVLETIHQRDLNQQSSFLKGLSTIVLKFEAKFLKRKIIPTLNGLVRNSQLAATVLPVYFTIMDQQNPPLINREEFNTMIWPSIKLLVTAKEISAAALFLLIQKLGLFVGYLDIKEIEVIFIPILLKSLACGVQKLQDLAIQQTLMIFDKIDYKILKSQIMPKVLELSLDNNVDLRKSAVLMLSKSFHVYDTVMINDQILPTLDKLRKMNNNYAINMAMLTVFQGVAKDIGTETIANKILPSLIPMLVVQTLSKSEYKAYMSTVYSYLKRIEDEQNRRYEGMPDKPPEEAQAELEKPSALNSQPQSQPSGPEGQFGGDFAFLNSSVPKGPEVSAPKSGEFDFSAFNTYNAQASAPSQVSNQASGRISFDPKPSANPFGLDNNAMQQRASINPQKMPATGNDAFQKQAQSTSGFNNLGPSAGAKSVTVQQNDPFKGFPQSNQASGAQGANQTTSFNQIQGSKPQNPFGGPQTKQTNPFAATAPSKQNTGSFDAFQSFDQFGSQPQKNVQQQQSFAQWGQPANSQPSASGGWDNLDNELENFSTTLARPTVQPKPVEKASQDNFGFAYDSNVNQATSVPAKQQQQSQPQPQSWQSQQQQQPSYQYQQYEQQQPEPQIQQEHQQQEQYYQQQQQEPYYQQQEQQYYQQNEYQQGQNQYDAYGGSYQNEFAQEEPQQYSEPQTYAEPQVQENPEQREAEIVATVGANHPLRYLGSNLGMSAIRGKR